MAVRQDAHGGGLRQNPERLFGAVLPCCGHSPDGDLHRFRHGLGGQDAVFCDACVGFGCLVQAPSCLQLRLKGHSPDGEGQAVAAGELLPLLGVDDGGGLDTHLRGGGEAGVFFHTHQPEGTGAEDRQFAARPLGRGALGIFQCPGVDGAAAHPAADHFGQLRNAGQIRHLLGQLLRQAADVQQLQAVAAGEAASAQLRQALGEADGGQARAVEERIAADGRHALFHFQRGDLVPVIIPGGQCAAAVVRHPALAGDGQHTLVAQQPGQAAALAIGNAGKSGQLLLLRGGLPGALGILKDLAAGAAGIVGVIAPRGMGGGNGLGLFHVVAQGVQHLGLRGSLRIPLPVLIDLAAGGAGVIFVVAAFSTSGGDSFGLHHTVAQGGDCLCRNTRLVLAQLVRKDLAAGGTCPIGVIAGFGAGRLSGLGHFHAVAQSFQFFGFCCGFRIALLVLVDLAAGRAGVVSVVALLRTGGGHGLGLFHGMAQGVQDFSLRGSLLLARFVLEDLAAGRTGVIGIGAALRAGGGDRFGLFHAVAQGGNGDLRQGGLLLAVPIQEDLMADGAENIVRIADLGAGGLCRRDYLHGVAQSVQGLGLHGGLPLARLILIDLAAGGTGVVGIVALLGAGGCNGLGLLHAVPQGGDGLGGHGGCFRTGLVLESTLAGGAEVIDPVALLRAGGSYGVHPDDGMAQSGQNLRGHGGLRLPRFVLENLMAVAAGIVDVVAVVNAGGGFSCRFRHAVAQSGKGLVLHGGQLPAQLVLVNPAAGIAEVIGIVAAGGAGGDNGGDQMQGADMGSGVVDVGGGEAIVSTIDFDLLPRHFIAAVVDIFQAGAVIERRIANTRHVFRNAHARQAAAAIEGIGANARHALWNAHACQAAAAVEGKVVNARHALWNAHARQAAATRESPLFNARHTLRDAHARQATAPRENTSSNTRHTLRNAHARQAAALRENRAANTRHAIWDHNIRQAATLRKNRV